MLSVLRVLDQYRSHEQAAMNKMGSTIRRDDFKVIYVYGYSSASYGLV